MSEALIFYNNAITANRWQMQDPKVAKIIALPTQVEKLVEMQTRLAVHAIQAPNNTGNSHNFQFTKIAA